MLYTYVHVNNYNFTNLIIPRLYLIRVKSDSSIISVIVFICTKVLKNKYVFHLLTTA